MERLYFIVKTMTKNDNRKYNDRLTNLTYFKGNYIECIE